MHEPKFNIEYQGAISANIDWVAGGNFEGYVYRKTMEFIKDNNLVILRTRVLDNRYDGEVENSETHGQFELTDHKTITCIFGKTRMRGKVLSEKKFIAFSVLHPNLRYPISECYELK